MIGIYSTKYIKHRCMPGWKGELCNECMIYPSCEHGTCIHAWQCLCKKNWGGLACHRSKFKIEKKYFL